MKKHYPWLFFDADGTLFDYKLAEATAFQKAFTLLDLPFEIRHLETYRQINHGLWQALERQEIKPDVLRIRRFELLLEALGLSSFPDRLSNVYTEQLGLCTELVEGAYEVLETLSMRCHIAIVTNGLQSVQRSRLERSTIRDFVSELIISEEVGAAKPHTAFFDVAFARTGNPSRREVLIIGDSLTSDMQGGINYGNDTCWYNPLGEPAPEGMSLTFEISQLLQLLERME